MRALQSVLMVAVFTIRLGADDAVMVGYVACPPGYVPPAVFSDPCTPQPLKTLSCGTKVKVLGQDGARLRIASTDGGEQYIGANWISQKKKQFLALDFPAQSGPYTRDCSSIRAKSGKVPARAIYAPDPQYTKQALRAKIQGSIKFALTIGTDGRVHQLKPLNRLGDGLDENAVEAVKTWKFEPAFQDGIPIESEISAEVSFHTW
jgi:TonB family protein